MIVGQRPTVLTVGGRGLDIFLSYHFSSSSLSLGDGPIETEIMSQRAVEPKATNHPTNLFIGCLLGNSPVKLMIKIVIKPSWVGTSFLA